jgi:nucleoside-diphosphate-sugar epimerase
MTIVLTGGTGFLGGHLVKALVAAGHRVLAYARPGSASVRPEGAEWFILDHGREDVAFRHGQVDAIIHTATCYGRAKESVPDLLAVNLLLPVLLARHAIHFGVPLFINTDTYFNRGDRGYDIMPDYSLSKHHALHWLRRCTADTGLRLANLRVEHMYGPNDRPEKFCPSVLGAMSRGEPELRLTTGEQRRDFIYVDDVVAAFLAVLERANDFTADNIQLSVGSGRSIPIRDFVCAGHRLARSRTKLLFGALPSRPEDFPDSQADNTALRNLGWEPQVDLETGISRVLSSISTST